MQACGKLTDLATSRNEKVLPVVRIDSVRDEATDGAGEAAVEPVDEEAFEDGALEEDILLAFSGVEGSG